MNPTEGIGERHRVSVYQAKGHIGWQAAGFIAGGILVLLMLLFHFLLLIGQTGGKSHDPTPGLVAGMGVGGIALLTRGLYLLSGVIRVTLDDAGIRVDRLISRQHIAWDMIDQIERDKQTHAFGGRATDVLKLIGTDGKPLGVIPATVDQFEAFAAEVARRSSLVRGTPTYNPAAGQQLRQSRDAKKARRSGFLALLMTMIFGAIFAAGVYEDLHLRRYATEGEVVEAKITRRYMVRVTPRLEYAFRDARGVTHTREAMMDEAAWDALEGSRTVPVQYLRSDPEWNRLVVGEQKETHLGGAFLLLSGGLTLATALMGLLLLGGFDVKSEKGQVQITRKGRLLKTFGKSPMPALIPVNESALPLPGTPPDWQPPPLLPLPSASPPSATRERRPGIIALGVLGIAFGLLGLMVGVVRLLAFRLQTLDVGGQTFVVEASALLRSWWIADGILAGLLLVAGVGLIMMRRWGRRLGIAVALLQVASAVGGVVFAAMAIAQLPTATGPESARQTAGAIGAVIGQLLGAVFPAVLLMILARRSTAEAFAPRTDAPTT